MHLLQWTEENMSWRLTAALLVALGVPAAPVAASPVGYAPPHHLKHAVVRAPRVTPDSYDISHYLVRPDPDYVGWAYVHHSPGRWIYFGHSYTYAPGKGIVDEACNLPTS